MPVQELGLAALERKPGEPPKQSTSKGQLPAATDEPMDESGPRSEEDTPLSGSESSLSVANVWSHVVPLGETPTYAMPRRLGAVTSLLWIKVRATRIRSAIVCIRNVWQVRRSSVNVVNVPVLQLHPI
ncbi:hypothetical protein HPB47_019202 [Ixodes persulcatus]|uniref:Uncharacterized protein n=1 Tax=Ixodes persulcatus TaxID=34615 RepID=A0AC60QJL9_IXOPE|nr:hypothetical protein HPB47_019202 [Ixodes persulcatus]